MRKHVLAAVLAMVMSLGLMVPVLASEAPSDGEGYNAITIDPGDGVLVEPEEPLVVYTANHGLGSIVEGDKASSRKTYGSYMKITPDTKITISNGSKDATSFVYLFFWKYTYYGEKTMVDFYYNDIVGKLNIGGSYYGRDVAVFLSDTEKESIPWVFDGKDFFTTTPTINDQYWVGWDYINPSFMEENAKLLHAGESTTFTLPECAPDENVLYVLYAQIYYPESGQAAYREYTFAFDGPPADTTDPAPSAPAAPEAPSDEVPGVTVTQPNPGVITVRVNPKATPTASNVLVNGEKKSFDAYNINGSNYFKLRDLAYVLSGTEKQFEVGWDGTANAISLTSGQAYTAVGGEMAVGNAKEQNAVYSTAKIFLDGKEVSLTAYNIGGNNYFKLRDVGKALDFGIGWDGASSTITIDTSTGYTE